MVNSVVQNVMKALAHSETPVVPVALWDLAPWMPSMLGVDCQDYYRNVDVKLRVQTEIQNSFPEAFICPGIFPDYGVVAEAVSMGCELQWMEDDAPYAHPCLHSASDVAKVKVINPQTDGLMPIVLQEYQYMHQHADRKLVTEYGYLEGTAFTMGPAEVAALMRGYDGLFLDFYDHPELVHKLLDIVTENLMTWVRAQEKVNGKVRRLFVVDHLSTQLSPDLYKEFFHPYLKRLFNEFHDAEMRLWHNEGRSSHVYPYLLDLGCNVYNFGADSVAEIKAAVGDEICLMGNLHSVHVIKDLTVAEVEAKSRECLMDGAAGGGLWLSGAGGLSPGTSKDKVRAMIKATLDYASSK